MFSLASRGGHILSLLSLWSQPCHLFASTSCFARPLKSYVHRSSSFLALRFWEDGLCGIGYLSPCEAMRRSIVDSSSTFQPFHQLVCSFLVHRN
jgi:hypothetical protein